MSGFATFIDPTRHTQTTAARHRSQLDAAPESTRTSATASAGDAENQRGATGEIAPSHAGVAPAAKPAAAFRLVVMLDGGTRYVARQTALRIVAETSIRTVLSEAALQGPIARITLQSGTHVGGLCYDPLKVVPGESGGWTYLKWADERSWSADELARVELLGAPPDPLA